MTPEELAHQQRVAGYLAKIKRLWQQATDEAAAMAGKVIGYDPTKPFNIINYPQTSKEMNRILTELHDNTQMLIEKGIDLEWYHANVNNDRLVKGWSKNKPRPPEQWMQHNEDARDAFKVRKQAGMNLSDRVWRITNEHKVNLEMAIDMSLYDGKSAQLLSQDIRQSLNEPNRLYRRVRDARGNLHLSKAAQSYHSGQGVYRSSYKNAMRVARTEHNLAYRYSDFYRTVQLDFVVGFEVHLSNNHTLNGVPFVDVCDELKGKYPKGFKFGGWHPQCRCYVTNILQDEDEFNMIEDKMLAGEDISGYVSPNTIWDTPKGFNNWVEKNMKRSEGWKSQPYWVKDNFKGGTLRGGLQIGKVAPPPVPVPAPVPPPVPKPPVPVPEPPKAGIKDFELQNTVKDAQKWAEDAGLADGVFYDELTLEEANEVNRTLWKLQKDAPMKFKKITSMRGKNFSEVDTLGFEDGASMFINIEDIRAAFATKKNLHEAIRVQIGELEARLAEFKRLKMRKYTASYNTRIEQLKNQLLSTPEWKCAADMQMEYLNRLSDVVTGGRMDILRSSVRSADMRLMEKASNRMAEALKDRNYRMQYTVKAFQSAPEFLNESYILYKRGMLKDPYTKDLIEEFIDKANGRVHIPAKIEPPPVVKKPWDASKSIHDQLASLKNPVEFKQWADEVLNVEDMWGDIKPEVRRQIFEEFHNLRTQYGFKRRITFGWESRPRAYASASHNTYNIKKSWWIEPDKLELQFASDVRQGWHPPTEGAGLKGGNIGRIAINRHEFGHVLTSNTLHFSSVPEFNAKINEIRKAYNVSKKEAFAAAKEEMKKNSDRVIQLWHDRNDVIRKINSGEFTPDMVDDAIKKIDDEVGVLQKRNIELTNWMKNPKEGWFVSNYADENIHEFAAECFSYSFDPNCTNTYALAVRALIDEYFKGNL
ncbi:MAG: hypothetical protein WC238_04695 [Parcubacteria group bacterium]|jgi:hypothetical protein